MKKIKIKLLIAISFNTMKTVKTARSIRS